MAERTGKERLEALQKQWKAEGIVYCLLLALAAVVLLTTALHAGVRWPLWVGWPIGILCFLTTLLLFPYWRIKMTDTSRYLDRSLPELEESCGLLLRVGTELGPLEKLQAVRTSEKLSRARVPDPLRKKMLTAAGLLVLAVLLGAGLTVLAGGSRSVKALATGIPGAAVARGSVAPAIRMVTIRITPPAYTGRPVRRQSAFSLQVEEGSLLSWELETTAAVDTLQFIFNDTARVSLQAANAERTLWRLTQPASRSGFYQVRTGQQLSGLYKLEIVRDEPPRVTILTPKPYTVLDYGESVKIPLTVRLKDDYGIADASIIATVSSGKGEAVKFKEQEIRWDRNFTGDQPAYELSKILDLAALGLKPGDELYFYCRAKDSRGQEGRTAMYIISLTDTAQLMSLEGIAMSSDIKPEYFRSERQIIIETEQLLKEKDTLNVASFHTRSNDLGIDQKLLRLRYGKFLGEEAEEGEPGSGGGAGDTTTFGTFGEAAKILDVFTDKHDNAEDATFFEPGVKQQLKATLSEMWKAELKLRTFQPQEALPYAYKALRLLKDLQQQSRAYVAKTGVRVTPLNPAKRLTGDLAAIQPPLQKVAGSEALPETAVLHIVLGILEGMSTGQLVPAEGSRVLLQQASRRLGREAAARPGEYLGAYQAMRGMVDRGERADIPVIEQAIRKLLPGVEAAPAAEKGAADAGLSQLYFHHLNEGSEKP
jgi:Domain of unknown function (DUF4175)